MGQNDGGKTMGAKRWGQNDGGKTMGAERWGQNDGADLTSGCDRPISLRAESKMKPVRCGTAGVPPETESSGTSRELF
ncbi:hypothetical protein Enr13x_76220 [Stieleria neptunia]|uniref:Uncharacterized protein n=1 Tax=Stieleria neptunia TaxID=2527979 RepID=A0A518I3M7_9BACT|nr:hypothetical protein Enr13x_76220 [Stieleria neptunia]